MDTPLRRAGVAKGTPYRYFPTKEALFSGVVEQEIAGAFIDFDSSKREPGESVEAFLRRSILAAMEDIERKGRAAIARLVAVGRSLSSTDRNLSHPDDGSAAQAA